MQKRTDRESKCQFNTYVNKSAIRLIQAYARQNSISPYDVLKDECASWENAIIKKAGEIDNMNRESALERLREEENRRIIDENPLKVTGESVEPIGTVTE